MSMKRPPVCHMSVRSVCCICPQQALSTSRLSVTGSITSVCRIKFEALFHGPLCHDFNQIARAKKVAKRFCNKNILQAFTPIKGHQSWVDPHQFSGCLIGFGDYELSDVAPNTTAVIQEYCRLISLYAYTYCMYHTRMDFRNGQNVELPSQKNNPILSLCWRGRQQNTNAEQSNRKQLQE